MTVQELNQRAGRTAFESSEEDHENDPSYEAGILGIDETEAEENRRKCPSRSG